MTAPALYLGIDIGCTKVAAGLVNDHGEILFKTRVPMVANLSAAHGFAAVKQAADAVLEANPGKTITGIGVTSPGPLDPRTGIVLNPPNLPCWRDFPLGDEVTKTFGIPTRVDNDANAAALAETLWGAGRGHRCVFYATLGTGIGTGIVIDGRIWHGRTGAAAEGGHVTIDYRGPQCGCGKRGCIEMLASGPVIAARAEQRCRSAAGRDSRILSLAGDDPRKITSEIVAAAWRAGDPIAEVVLRETAGFLAIWLGNVIDLLEPDVIVVGGGVGELMSEWFDFIRGVLPGWSINQRCREIPLLLAKYKEDAGIAGAAALCLADETP